MLSSMYAASPLFWTYGKPTPSERRCTKVAQDGDSYVREPNGLNF